MRMFFKQMTGIGGCGLLIAGCFLPLLKFPNVSYWSNGQGDGVIVVILAALTALFLLIRWNKLAFVAGLLASGMIAYLFYNLIGLYQSVGSLQQWLDWGALPLALGAVLVFAAILIPGSARPAREALQPMPASIRDTQPMKAVPMPAHVLDTQPVKVIPQAQMKPIDPWYADRRKLVAMIALAGTAVLMAVGLLLLYLSNIMPSAQPFYYSVSDDVPDNPPFDAVGIPAQEIRTAFIEHCRTQFGLSNTCVSEFTIISAEKAPRLPNDVWYDFDELWCVKADRKLLPNAAWESDHITIARTGLRWWVYEFFGGRPSRNTWLSYSCTNW